MLSTADREMWRHRAEVRDDGRTDEPVTFLWHFPRGTFDKRMSGLELATFLMPHMPSILPLLWGHKQAWLEFKMLLDRLSLWPREVLDEVVPWIRSVTREGPDDIVHLELFAKEAPPAGPAYFLPGEAGQ